MSKIIAGLFPLAIIVSCSQPLEPGQYLSPFVRLERLEGESRHLHTDEVRYRDDGKIFQCSYTFGVVDARDPGSMRYEAQNLRHTIPNDTRRPGCIHLAWDGDIVYTTHRGNIDNPAFLTGWRLEPHPGRPNALAPVQLPVLQEAGVSYEGIDVANGNIFVGLHEKGLGVYRREAGDQIVRIGAAGGLVDAFGVRVRDKTVFVADGLGGLATVDVTDPRNPKVLGRVATGGHARGVVVNGHVAYVAAGSAGLVIVDISQLAAPKVIATATMPGTAIRVDYSAGRVFVAAWNDARAYDVADPTKPRFIGAVRLTQELSSSEEGRPASTARTLGIAAKDDVVFVGNWWVLYSFRVYPDRTAPSIQLPETVSQIDFGPVAEGTTKSLPLDVTNQGTAPLTLFNIWTEAEPFGVTPRQVRVPPGAKTTLTLSYKAAKQEKEAAILQIWSDDPDAPVRKAYLVGNQPGLGVGTMLPKTTVSLVDGGEWSSSQAGGKVQLLAYFATF